MKFLYLLINHLYGSHCHAHLDFTVIRIHEKNRSLTCHRRRSLRPGCCSTGGLQQGSTPGSPDPSLSTCCTGRPRYTVFIISPQTYLLRLQTHRQLHGVALEFTLFSSTKKRPPRTCFLNQRSKESQIQNSV